MIRRLSELRTCCLLTCEPGLVEIKHKFWIKKFIVYCLLKPHIVMKSCFTFRGKSLWTGFNVNSLIAIWIEVLEVAHYKANLWNDLHGLASNRALVSSSFSSISTLFYFIYFFVFFVFNRNCFFFFVLMGWNFLLQFSPVSVHFEYNNEQY